jgi:hypothetical protein
MTTKAELQAARRAMMAEERARLGDPPTAEELLAYSRGELSPDQEERVRELLVCYPELARTLTEPFPEAARRGDADYLPDEEFAKHWESMKTRVGEPDTKVVPFRRPVWAALAAALALVFGASFVYEYAKVRQLTAERMQPRALASQEPVALYPDTRRGGDPAPPTVLSPEGQPSVLVVPMRYGEEFPRYRLELVDTAAKRTVWQTEIPRQTDQDSFTITVPGTFLKRGKYRMTVSGLERGEPQELASYGLAVPATP